eukprot:8029393-Lingulodinium_polyedra.AAC.1
MAPIAARWEKEGVGVRLLSCSAANGRPVSRDWRADNFFGLARSREELARIFGDVTKGLREHGFGWEDSTLSFLVCGREDAKPIE